MPAGSPRFESVERGSLERGCLPKRVAYSPAMPELAEVLYYSKVWNAGRGEKVIRVHVHPGKRIFRGMDAHKLETSLPGRKLERAEVHGKQLLFGFSKGLWLGLHLGMTGKLLVMPKDFQPGKHDHLVLYQPKRALVFTDPRLFGRVRLNASPAPPEWWSSLPPAIDSPNFTRERMDTFLQRHARLPIKSALLLQEGFPGVGNWLADEVLWQAKINPLSPSGRLSAKERRQVWEKVRQVCHEAVLQISPEFEDPPPGWLFHERWRRAGLCPIHRTPLRKQMVGGRNTAWCPRCQKGRLG